MSQSDNMELDHEEGVRAPLPKFAMSGESQQSRPDDETYRYLRKPCSGKLTDSGQTAIHTMSLLSHILAHTTHFDS
jgi:hypothetical protein